MQQTISTQLPYVSLRSRAQAYVPVHYYRSSVNGYVLLTGFASLPLFRQVRRIRSQQSRNPLQHESIDLPITRAMSLKKFILQSSHLTEAEMILMIQWPPKRVSQCRQFLRVPRNESKTQRNMSHTISADDYLPTAAINHRLAEEMQLPSRCPLTRRFTRRAIHEAGDDI